MLDFHNTISHKLWSAEEAQKSSSYRELKAISLGLESFLPLVKGHTIKWYTDYQSVSRIVEVGSMKEDLQCLALRFFTMCMLCCITLEVEWIPRSANDKADFFLAKLWIMMIRGSRGTIFFWPKKNGVLTLLTGLRTMRILSCPVLIADFGALVHRRLMPFLFLGRVRIICSFP